VTISKCFNKLIEYYTILVPSVQLRFLAFSFIDRFSKNLEKYYNTSVYQNFYKSCLQMLNVCIKKGILEDEYHITMLAAAIVYYQIQQFEFSNLDLDDVSNVFNLKCVNIEKYYQLIKNE